MSQTLLQCETVTAIFDQMHHKNTILKAQSRDHNVGTS
jgi:hypothetical protein